MLMLMSKYEPALSIFIVTVVGDQLTANLTAKTRIFDSNFDFYDSRRYLDFTVVDFRDHVTELKPKQRDHPLKFAELHNHSPLLTMVYLGSKSAILSYPIYDLTL